MSENKQQVYEQRCQIYALKKTKISQQKIADIVGVDQSAISRELSRNTGAKGYRFIQAQNMAEKCRKAAIKATKMTPV